MSVEWGKSQMIYGYFSQLSNAYRYNLIVQPKAGRLYLYLINTEHERLGSAAEPDVIRRFGTRASR